MTLTVSHKFRVINESVEYEFEVAEEGGYVVSVPAYPGAVSEGDTFEEALENGEDALRTCLAAAKQLGLEIPPELVPLAG